MSYKTPKGNIMYSSSDLHELEMKRLPEELIEAMRVRDEKLAAIGATVVNLHDEYIIEAPEGKQREAMEIVEEYTRKLLAYQMRGFEKFKIPVEGDLGQTWDDAKKLK